MESERSLNRNYSWPFPHQHNFTLPENLLHTLKCHLVYLHKSSIKKTFFICAPLQMKKTRVLRKKYLLQDHISNKGRSRLWPQNSFKIYFRPIIKSLLMGTNETPTRPLSVQPTSSQAIFHGLSARSNGGFIPELITLCELVFSLEDDMHPFCLVLPFGHKCVLTARKLMKFWKEQWENQHLTLKLEDQK